MIAGFLGILISLERSVALGSVVGLRRSSTNSDRNDLRTHGTGGTRWSAADCDGNAAMIGNFVAILRRQAALFTWTIALGAVAWLIGNLFWLSGAELPSMVHCGPPSWF
jgi:hypothetical protein